MNVSLRTTACFTSNTTTSNNNTKNAIQALPSLLRWFFVFMMLGAFTANAQLVANYSFNQTSQTYTPITGGTDPLNLTAWDDQTATGIPLGFTFNFNGTNYTTVNVNANGYITFGTSASLGSTPISSSSAADGVVSAFTRDLNANGSPITYLTTGSSGSQIFTMQWENARRYNVAGDTMNFQIRLHETSNLIEIVYGYCNVTGATSNTVQVGLRGTSSADFNNRTSTTDWSATTAGGTSSAGVTVASGIIPASGLTFTYTAPGPCVTPTAQPTGLTLTPSGLSVLNGSFTAAAPPPTGYLVVRTTTNVAPTPVDGTSYSVGTNAIGYIESFGTGTTWSSTGLLSNTTYYYWIFSHNNTLCSGGPLYLTTAPLTGNETTGACSISGTKTVGGVGADYANMTDAINALVNNGISGAVVLQINGALAAQTYPIVLPAVPCASSTNTITIRPGAASTVITASSATGIFVIDGGQHYIIDGRIGSSGTTKDLTISNTSSATGGAAIRFINEASNNIVRYTTLRSSFGSNTSGIIEFAGTTGANGNDNNTIEYNNIDGGAGAAASPTTGVSQIGIYATGSTASENNKNSGNIISNNNIFDHFKTGAATTNAAIYVDNGNTEWTISGNSIYQTATRTAGGFIATMYGIYLNNNGNGFTVSNNFIGGTAPGATGGSYTVNGAQNHRMTAIGLNVGSAIASSVQGNTITNISFTTTMLSTSITVSTTSITAGTWAGIVVTGGNVNVGTVTGNIIGSGSSTGAISVIRTGTSTSAAYATGIAVDGEGIVDVSNNSIGGITLSATGATTPHGAYILWNGSSSGGVTTMQNNIVGSATQANSIQTNANTGTVAIDIFGIYNASTGTIEVTDNLIANITHNTQSSSTSSNFAGINIASGIANVSGNTIRDLNGSILGTSTAHAIAGIDFNSATTGDWSISNNNIYNLNNTRATGTVYVSGIISNGPATGNGVVSNNNIYNLRATSSSSTVTGIYAIARSVPYYNNTIRLGVSSTDATINGMYVTSGSTNSPSVYHNTIYIGGSANANANHSFAFSSDQATNAQVIQNNIFINGRSNGGTATGKHYAVSLASNTGLTMDYNIYRATGTGGVFGRFNSIDQADLTAWRTATTQDLNSKDLDPCLADPTAATPDLHLTNCATLGSPADGGGTPVALVTTDMDGQDRSTLSPVDIGADAGDYGPSGVDVGVIALVRPTATSCHTTTEDVIVTLKNFSTSVHDFTVNPVTITTDITGQLTAGPLSVTINTGTLAAGANLDVTVGTADMVTNGNGTYTFTSSSSVTGDVTPGNDGNVTNVELDYTALSVVATASNSSICISGETNLIATPTGGTAPYTYLWDAGTDLDSNVNNTGTITISGTYNVTVTDACGVTANSSVNVTVLSPSVASTTPGTRCGEGTVELGATISGGTTLTWYDAPSGGTPLGTGTTFTTPVINTTTPYYVSASDGGTTVTGGGRLAPASTSNTAPGDWGLVFDVTTAFTLVSFEVYPLDATPGNITIKLQDNTGSPILTSALIPIPAGDGTVPYTVSVGWPIPIGTGYRILLDGDINLIRESSIGGFPYPIGSAGSITNGYISGNSTTYYFMYNWTVSTGCESARTAVTATVTTPPAITASATSNSICFGSSTTLNVTSPNDPNYSYNWLPDTLIGPSHIVTPDSTTAYLVTAVDSSGGANDGCATSAIVNVTVNPVPGPVVITPAATVVACQNGGVDITATSLVPGSGTIGTGTSTTATTTPYPGTWGATKVQFLYTAAELEGMGMSPGDDITSVGLSVTSFDAPYTFNGFTIRMKNTSSTSLTSTYETGTTDVYGPLNYTLTGTAPFITQHVLTSPFEWDGASNVIVEFCFANGDAGTTGKAASVAYTTTTGHAVYDLEDNSLTHCADVSGATSSSRVNMHFTFNTGVDITWSPADGLSSTSGATVNANPLSPTLYTATATLGACQTSNTVQVNLSDLAITSATGTDITCFGGNNGTIDVTATGGTAPYEYSVDGTNWQSSSNFTGLIAGTYTVSVRDANAPNNCVVTASVTLNEPAAAVTVTATGVDPVCNGASDGSVINVVGAGGTGGYTYTITGGSFTGLAAGTYTITATDASGCTGTVDVTLTDPALPTVAATNNSPVCAGTDVVLTATPGYAAYSWTGPGTINNATTDIATAVAPNHNDVFTVTITDANGCTNSASTTVTVNPNLPVSVNVGVEPSTEVCSGTMVTFTATPVNGGTNPTYQWYVNNVALVDSTNSTLQVNNLSDQDVVTVVVTSDETCTAGNPATSDPITITITGAIEASVAIAPVAPSVCVGQPITITATGSGTGNFPVYDFYINNNPVQTGSSNTYTYTPTDQDLVYVIMTSSYSCATNNPAVSNFETISVYPYPDQPTVTADGPLTFCDGGSVTLTSSAVGGNLWSPGNETTDAIVVTTSGSYTVTQTVNGCTSPASEPVVVTVNTATATITPSGPVTTCTNEEVTFTASATPAAVSYLWSPGGQTTDTIKTAVAGTYTVTTTDANGCTATASVTVSTNTAPSVSISGPSVICTGLTETLTASATPGSGNIISYQWMLNGDTIPGATGTSHVATINGNYTILVSDDLGCTTESDVHVLGLNGPMVGTYTVSSAPASCTNYNTLALAVYDLSNRGLAGNVIIDVEPGHTETAPAGGIVLNQCSLTAGLEATSSQTITIKKASAGTNPLITAGTGSGSQDAIFANLGTDYVTIDGIDLIENVANTDSAMQMEYGYILTNCGDNGVQHNLLQNNTVTLDKNNGNGSTGIYVINNGTITTTAGASSNNKIYSNTVSNVLSGIRVEGYADPNAPYALYGQNNEVGAVGQGNTITNFGNSVKSLASYGVRTAAQNNVLVVGNNINSTTGNNIGLVNGIAVRDSRWANSTISDNTVTIGSTQTGGSQFVGINNNSGSRLPGATVNNIVNITNNTITNCSYVGSGDLWLLGNFKPGVDSLGAWRVNITGNNLTNNSSASTGTSNFYGMLCQVGIDSLTVSNNTITGNSTTGGVSRSTTAMEIDFGQPLDAQIIQKITISGNTIANNSTASTTGSYTGISTILTGLGVNPLAGSLLTISNNNVNNITASAATTGAFTGITTSASTNIGITMTGNTVSNITRPSTLTTGAFNGIRATGSAFTSIDFSNNNVNTISQPNGTSGTWTVMEAAGSSTSTLTKSITNNTIDNLSFTTTTGTSYMLDVGLAVTSTVSGNTITNVTRNLNSGTLYTIWSSTATDLTITGNTLNNIQLANTTGTSSSILYGIYNASSPVNENYTNNTITNFGLNGAGTSTSSLIRGIYSNSTSSSVKNISGNIVHSFSTNVPGSIEGIISSLGSPDIYQNKVYNLSTSSSSTSASAYGISVTSGTAIRVFNNIIGDLRSTVASATDPVRGISITSTSTSSTVGLYYNSIYLDGTSSGTNFGNTGIYTTTSTTATTATLDMRNNLVYNASVAKGTGRVVAYRRSTTSLTNMGPDVNNNLYYVTAAANHHVFSNGTNHLDLAGYKALSGIAPRESNSVTENVSFQSTTASSVDFLKVSTATPTLVEGGGQAIAGITTDYFGTTRAGVGPDIGAHEDVFQNIQLNFSSISASPNTTQCVATARTITAVMDEGAAPIVSVTLYYAFDGGTPVSVPMSNGGSGLTYTGTIPAATPGNAVVTWYVTASDGTYTPTTATQSYQDELLTGTIVVASANPGTVCSGSPSVLTAQVSNPGTAQLGTSTSTNSTYPFRRFWGAAKTQMVYLASELTAAGLSAGPITSIGFDISSASSDMPNFKVSMKQTATAQLTTAGGYETGMTEVYSTALFTPVVGINSYPVSGFTWDGISNIIVEVCFAANDAGASSSSARVSNPGFSATLQSTEDNNPNFCANPTTSLTATSTVRPNLYIDGNTASGTFTYVWSDGTNTVGTEDTITVNPLATTNYTVTATNQDGCSITSAPVAVSVVPLTADSIEVSPAVCSNGFTLTAHTSGGGEPYSYTWSDGTNTYPDAQTITPVLAPGTYNFSVTVNDGCGGSVVMNTTVTVNGLPTIAVTSDPANAKVCGTAATLTATGGISYEWAPADGLSATTGDIVTALPTDTTSYVVFGTDANGCVNTDTITLIVESPITMTASASPSTICAGNDVQLDASASLGELLIGESVDDAPVAAIPIGFDFVFDNDTLTHFSASPDGFIRLGTTTASSQFTNSMTSTTNIPKIAPLWDDLHTGVGGHVKYIVNGTAPNRIGIVEWFVTIPRSTTGPANAKFQLWMYETTNVVEFRYGSMGNPVSASSGLVGLTAASNYNSITFSDNTASNSTANNTNAVSPAAGTMYVFTPAEDTTRAKDYAFSVSTGTLDALQGAGLTYSWSPATYLNDANIANPLASNMQDSVDYVVTITKVETGCSVTDTVSVIVNPLPAATFTGLAATYCSSDGAATLTGTPANGTFTGPGISGNVFSPSVAGPGTHTITYSVTDISTGCSNSTTQQVTVQGPTVSFIGLAGPYCTNAAIVTLTGNQAPLGTFSGPGITDNLDGTATFNPATAGAGTYNISYSYTDINGCSASDVQSVTVNATTSLAFSGLAATYCDNSAVATLTSNQTGGTFSGSGITDNGDGTAIFSPATAGQGTHTITFTFTNGSGCTSSTSQQTTVGAGATVSFSGLAASYCYDVENVVTLTGSPAGGTFSGNGISGNTFTPSVVGTYDITYSYDNGSCITTATQSVTVNALPTVSFSGLAGPYCADAAAVTLTGSPAGGTFSGPGISGDTFDPAVAGAGTWTIIYNYTDGNGCSNSAEQQVTVNALPTVSFSGLAATYCTTDASVTLTGSPVGGTFSGPGITGDTFDPAAAGVGTHTITYTYTDGNGCTATATQQVEVEVCTPTFVTVNVKAYLEGFYTGGGTMMSTLYDLGMDTDPTATDTIEVNLWSPTNLSSPTPDYSVKVILHNDGNASAQFPSAVNGGSYYIAIKHRNSLETWSKNPLTMASTNTYDFSTSAAQAYDDGFNSPMKDMGGVFAFYSGDNNQDGTVDVVDMIAVDNDASVFAFGYNATDCTGDGSSDLLDIIVIDNNSALFLFYARPY